MDIPQGPIELPDLDYQDLSAPNAVDSNTISQLDANINHSNWITIHYCITEIRKINKFYPQYAIDIIDRYNKPLVELFSNSKTQLMKNLLRLVKELFDLGKSINVQKAVFAFVPSIIKKASTDIGHIKVMAQHVLTSFVLNCGYDISFTVSAGFCVDSNANMAELSIKILGNLLQKAGGNITQLNPDTLKSIMNSMKILIEGKRNNLKNQALDLCIFIYNLIGSQNYLQLMNFALMPQDVQIMGTAMENHRSSKKKNQVPLSIAKQQRKTEMMGNMMGNNQNIAVVNKEFQNQEDQNYMYNNNSYSNNNNYNSNNNYNNYNNNNNNSSFYNGSGFHQNMR